MAATVISFFAGFQLGHRIVQAADQRYTVGLGVNYILTVPFQVELAFLSSEVVARLVRAIPFALLRVPISAGCSAAPFVAVPLIVLCAAFKHNQYTGVAQVFNKLLKTARTFARTLLASQAPEPIVQGLKKVCAVFPTCPLPAEFPEVLSESQARVVGLIAEHSSTIMISATIVGVVALKFFAKSGFFVGIVCSSGYGILNHYNYIPEEPALFVETYFSVVAFVGRVFGGGGFTSSIMATASLCLLNFNLMIIFFQKLEELISYVVATAILEESLKAWALAAIKPMGEKAPAWQELLDNLQALLSSVIGGVSSFKKQIERKEWNEIFFSEDTPLSLQEAIELFQKEPDSYEPNVGVWAQARAETALARAPKDYGFNRFLVLFKQISWDQKYPLVRAKLMDDERFIDRVIKQKFPNYARKPHPFGRFLDETLQLQKDLKAQEALAQKNPGISIDVDSMLKAKCLEDVLRLKLELAGASKLRARYKNATRAPAFRHQLIESLMELQGLTAADYKQIKSWEGMDKRALVGCVLESRGDLDKIIMSNMAAGASKQELIEACAPFFHSKEMILATKDDLFKILVESKKISVEDYKQISAIEKLSLDELQGLIAQKQNMSVEECRCQGFFGGLGREELVSLLAQSKNLTVDEYVNLKTCEELLIDEVVEALIEVDGASTTKEKYLAGWAEAQMVTFVNKLTNQDTEAEQSKRPLIELRPIFAAILFYVDHLEDVVEKEDMLLSLAIEGGAFCSVAYEDLAKDRSEPVVQKYWKDKDPLRRHEEKMLDLFEKDRRTFFANLYVSLQKSLPLFSKLMNSDRHTVGWIRVCLFGFLPLFKYEVQRFTLAQFLAWKCSTIIRHFLYQSYFEGKAVRRLTAFFDEAKVGVEGTEYVNDKLQITGDAAKVAAFNDAICEAPPEAFKQLYFVLLGILKKKESEQEA